MGEQKVSKQRWKATKLPVEVLDEMELVRAKLILEREWIKKLPPELIDPKVCPICGSKIKKSEVQVKMSYAYCESCGFKQPTINIEAIGDDISTLATMLGLGFLVGLGIAALAYLLFQKNVQQR